MKPERPIPTIPEIALMINSVFLHTYFALFSMIIIVVPTFTFSTLFYICCQIEWDILLLPIRIEIHSQMEMRNTSCVIIRVTFNDAIRSRGRATCYDNDGDSDRDDDDDDSPSCTSYNAP